MHDPSSQPARLVELAPAAERWAILALASGAFAMALNANVMAAFYPFRDGIPEMLGGSWGHLTGIAGLAGAVGAFLLGPLVDRFGRRPPMVIGMAAFTLGSFGHVLAGSFEQLMWARGIAGFSAGVAYSSASAAVADIVPYERRGKAMGVFTAGMFLGLPVGLPLAGVLAGHHLWHWVFVVQGAVGVFAMASMYRYLPPGLGRGSRFVENLPRLWSREVLAALGSVLLYVGSFFTAVQFVGKWLDSTHLVAKEDQWSIWVILGVCSAIGSLTLARFSDRFGKRTWSNLTCAVVAACLLALAFVDRILVLMLVGIPLALVSAARSGPFQALTSELVPYDTRGTLMGVRSAAVNLGTGLFPTLVFGICGENYRSMLYFSVCGVLGALLLVVLFVKQR